MNTARFHPARRQARGGKRGRVAGVVGLIAAVLAMAGTLSAAASTSSASAPSSFVAIAPVTIVKSVTVAANGRLDRTVSGTSSVPRAASAVVLNVNVTSGRTAGSLLIGPTGDLPTTPGVRWSARQPVATSVTVRPSAHGAVSFKDQGGTAVVRAQVVAYYIPSSTPLPRALVATGNRVSINRTFSAVLAAAVPTGNFLVTASTSLASSFTGLDDVACRIEDPDGTVLAEALTSAGFLNDVSLQATLTLQAVVRSPGEQLRLMCADDQADGQTFDQRITAVEVGAVIGT